MKQTTHGRREDKITETGEDEVTEAGLESFPASDPPAFNQAGRDRKAADRGDAAQPEAADGRQVRARASDEPAPMPEPVKEGRRFGGSLLKFAILVLIVLAGLWLALT